MTKRTLLVAATIALLAPAVLGAFQLNEPQQNEMSFKTNNTEWLRLDKNGNFGIGTSTPRSVLDVHGQATINNGALTIHNITANTTPVPGDSLANGRIATRHSKQRGPELVMSSESNAPRTVYQNVLTGSTATPENQAWIGLSQPVPGTTAGRAPSYRHANSLTVDANTVGIGTTKPNAALTVNTTGAHISDPAFTQDDQNTTSNDDLTVTGNYTGDHATVYTVRIASTGSTDTYEWTNTETNGWSDETAINGEQPLSNGLNASFASDDGHDTGDTWRFTAYPRRDPLRVTDADGDDVLSVNADSNETDVTINGSTTIRSESGAGINVTDDGNVIIRLG